MRTGKRTALAALAVAAIAVATILAGKFEGSTPVTSELFPRPAGRLLPFIWHDAPKPLPEIAFAAPDKTPASFGDFTGGITLVNLWATWCAPCLREMPMLNALAGTVEDLKVVALNQNRGGMAVAGPFWEEKGFANLALYLDPTFSAAGMLVERGLPLTILLDRDGQEIARLEGIAEWDAPEVIAYFQVLTAK